MVSTRGVRYKFSEGERVLCYEPDPTKAKVLYDSKVLEVIESKDKRGRRTMEYLIHFQGWNSSWDRCVSEDFVLKDTEENRQLQRDLAEKSQLQLGAYLYRRERKKGSTASAGAGPAKRPRLGFSDDGSSTSTQPDEGETAGDTDSSAGSVGSRARTPPPPHVGRAQIALPPALRDLLTFDYHLVVKRGRLSQLPASPSAADILESFVKWFARSGAWRPAPHAPARARVGVGAGPDPPHRPDLADVCCRLNLVREVADGLRVYFDFILRGHLLYKQEATQYEELCGNYHTRQEVFETEESHKEGESAGTEESHKEGESAGTEESHKEGESAGTEESHKEGESAGTEESYKEGGSAETEERHNKEGSAVTEESHTEGGGGGGGGASVVELDIKSPKIPEYAHLPPDPSELDNDAHGSQSNEELKSPVTKTETNDTNNATDKDKTADDKTREDEISDEKTHIEKTPNDKISNDKTYKITASDKTCNDRTTNDKTLKEKSPSDKTKETSSSDKTSTDKVLREKPNDKAAKSKTPSDKAAKDNANSEKPKVKTPTEKLAKDKPSSEKLNDKTPNVKVASEKTPNEKTSNDNTLTDKFSNDKLAVAALPERIVSEEQNSLGAKTPRESRCAARSGNLARRLRSHKSAAPETEGEPEAATSTKPVSSPGQSAVAAVASPNLASTSTNLPSTSANQASTPTNLAAASTNLAATSTNLASTSTNLASSSANLASTAAIVATTSANMASTSANLASTSVAAASVPVAGAVLPVEPRIFETLSSSVCSSESTVSSGWAARRASAPVPAGQVTRTPLSLLLDKVAKWQIIPREGTEHLPCRVYGAIHLARLFVKLPDFLNATQMPDIKLKLILKHIDMFVQYLEEHNEWFGEMYYVDTARSR